MIIPDKIDVCCPTRDKVSADWMKRLRYLPLNNLFIDNSHRPLGWKRKNLIEKVTTEYFLFLDDDAYIERSTFGGLCTLFNDNIGAVEGFLRVVGVGDWAPFFDMLLPTKSYTLQRNERGFTLCTLVKTELVKDWVPSTPKLSAVEDWEISKHIQSKHYSWVRTQVSGVHLKSKIGVLRGQRWYERSYKEAYRPDIRETLGKVHSYSKPIPQQVLDRLRRRISHALFTYEFMHELYHIWGLMT